MEKILVLQQLSTQIEHLRQEAQIAARNAHLAAVDDQSVAETQYDTLAIEASYLAEGQSKRINELTRTINALKAFKIEPCSTVKLGALFAIEFEEEINNTAWFYLCPAGAGQKLSFNDHTIHVITPNAPLAKSCMNAAIDDEVTINLANKNRYGVITKIQ